MSCNYLLTNAINALCTPPSKGFERIGYVCNYSDIDQTTIDIVDNMGTFALSSGQLYPVYDFSKRPFEGSGITSEESAPHGFTLHNDVIVFPFIANNVLNAASAEIIKNSRLVFVLENKEKGSDDSSRWQIFGISGGLIPTTINSDASTDVAWVVSLIDKNTDSTGFFWWKLDKETTDYFAYAFTKATRWNNALFYAANDVVLYESQMYLSYIDDNYEVPGIGANWTVI